jgi:hypothetical protein
VVRHTEIANTLNNGQSIEIANTPNNGQQKEDLLVESAIYKKASQQAMEANPSYGEYVLEARKAETKELNLPSMLDQPEPEKSLKDIIPKQYHNYLDIFSEKEAIPLLPHCPWDHVVKLVANAPPSIFYRVYLLSQAEEEF